MCVRVSVEGCVEGSVKNCSVDGWDKLPLGLKATVVENDDRHELPIAAEEAECVCGGDGGSAEQASQFVHAATT